jgi:1,4-dihydroxy-6-naphthoate synthase
MRVRLGHSDDPDDAFMVWALAERRIDLRGFEFELVPADIQTLNEWALEGRLDVTALSLAAYPHVQDTYALLPHGASIGAGYGPVVVSREPLGADRLRETEVVVPGRLTTAFLVLGLALGGTFRFRELPFDRILDEVREGRAEAGLIIHEGQLTYAAAGLVKSLDLGEWWLAETDLPLPLGVNCVRRDLERLDDLTAVLGEAIEAALAHRDEALAYALRFARDLDGATADEFVGMYVNELTRDFGDEGRRAVDELLRRAQAAGVYDGVRVEYAGRSID